MSASRTFIRTLFRLSSSSRPLSELSRSYGTSLSAATPSRKPATWGTALAVVSAAGLVGIVAFGPSISLDSSSPVPLPGKATKSLVAPTSPLIPYSEVNKHDKEGDLWVVLNNDVYDLSSFAHVHPGGIEPLLKFAGRDASALFNPLHPPGTIESASNLPPSALVGKVDPSTLPAPPPVAALEEGGEASGETPLSMIIGLPDFDDAARRKLPSKAWNYYSAGGTDETTVDLNRTCWNKILFRPRVMNDVSEVDFTTELLGYPVEMPVFISPAGMARLSHPEGEKLFARGAGEAGIIQFISTNASAPIEEILSGATSSEQPFFFQLYVSKVREDTEQLLKRVQATGQVKAIFATVDTAARGKRERDERDQAAIEVSTGMSGKKITGGGLGKGSGSFIDNKLNWGDLAWLRRHTSLPIGLKGLQTVEDCKKAYDLGVTGLYLSNHGGRSLDCSPPALYTLLELHKYYPEILADQKVEVFIDGGVRRGSDVVKALCLGANGVGMGRPLMYALTYGQEGVDHALGIMRDEIKTTLAFLGVTSLKDLGPHLINTKAIDPLLNDDPRFLK